VLATHDVQEAMTLADRVLLIEHGNLTMDLAVRLPHPRARDDAALISLEKQVLSRVLDVRHTEIHLNTNSCG
jgi:sulfonate transport system ATP-binding protein